MNRPGRPCHGEEAKRCAIGVRVTPAMRSSIDAAAAANGRSLSQEVEFRLERSFRDDDIVERIKAAQRFVKLDIPAVSFRSATDMVLPPPIVSALREAVDGAV